MRGIKSKNHNLGTYKTNKISLSCFDDKRYILRNGIETFAYEHKDIKMIDLDTITNEKKKTMKKWPYISDHLYIILIIGGSGSGKTNTLLNSINEQHDIDKMHLYARDLNEPKYKILIKKCKDAGIKHLNDPNAFIECSNTMDDVYENIHDYNSSRKRKILIVFDDMIADIMTNKKFQAIITELFIRCRKLNISLAFIAQSYLSVPKDVRFN